MDSQICQCHVARRAPLRFSCGTRPAEPLRCDALDGQYEHALSIARESAGGVGVGRFAPLLRLYGLETRREKCGSTQYGVPPVFALWRQEVLLQRFLLPYRHSATNGGFGGAACARCAAVVV